MQDQVLNPAGSPSLEQEQKEGGSSPADLQHALAWSFDPGAGLDRPFHDLVSQFGVEIVQALDAIVLDTPVRAAVRATQVYQTYAARAGVEMDTDSVMRHFAKILRPVIAQADEAPLVPEPAVYRGRERMAG